MKIRVKPETMVLETFPATLVMDRRFAWDFLAAAAFFTRKLHEIEKTHKKESVGKVPVNEHRYFYYPTIFLSFSAVEATLNEIVFTKHSKITDERLFENERYLPFADKASDLFKDLAKKEMNSKKFERVKVLQRLRDSFTHSRPISNAACSGPWEPRFPDETKFETQKNKHSRLVKNLKAQKFNLNPWYKGNPFYPNQIVSHGCAEWAVKTAFSFIKFYRTELGLNMKDFDRDYSTRV